jgi:hypothetical protein
LTKLQIKGEAPGKALLRSPLPRLLKYLFHRLPKRDLAEFEQLTIRTRN